MTKKLLAAIAAAALWAPAAHATNGMRMIGFGTAQNAMGGVSAALALDAATVATNPAGLLAVGHRLDLSGTYFQPTVSYNATEVPGMGGFAVASPNQVQSTMDPSFIPAVGYAVRINDKIATGVGFYGAAGMGVEYADNLYGGATHSSYSQARVTPGVAYQVMPNLAIGATLNLAYATMGYELAGGMGMPERKPTSALGFGAVLGAMYTPIEMVTVGAALETQTYFQDFEWSIPAHTQMVPGVGPVAFPGGKEKLAFDQPMMATLGVAVRPLAGLTLAADGEFINWAQTNGKDKPKITGNEATGGMPFDLNWKNQFVVKLGLQYEPTTSLRVRAGFNYGKQPLDKTRAVENIAFPAVAETHWTAGFGADLTPNLTITGTMMYAPRVQLSGSNPEQFISSYTTNMEQLAFDLGLGWRF